VPPKESKITTNHYGELWSIQAIIIGISCEFNQLSLKIPRNSTSHHEEFSQNFINHGDLFTIQKVMNYMYASNGRDIQGIIFYKLMGLGAWSFPS